MSREQFNQDDFPFSNSLIYICLVASMIKLSCISQERMNYEREVRTSERILCGGICFWLFPITLMILWTIRIVLRPLWGNHWSKGPEIGPFIPPLKAIQHHAEGLGTEQLAGIHCFPQGLFSEADDCQQECLNAGFPARAVPAATKPNQTGAHRRQITAALSTAHALRRFEPYFSLRL